MYNYFNIIVGVILMNIVLIGMPGCGKSTIGVILAKSLLCNFIDTDILIQNKYKKSLCEIIESVGIKEFKKIENEVISNIKCDNCVIATGGSAVYGAEAMKNLKSNGKIFYLQLTNEEIQSRIKNIKSRGVVMNKHCTLQDLFNERTPLYELYSDITVNCSGLSVEQCVNIIVDKIYKMT